MPLNESLVVILTAPSADAVWRLRGDLLEAGTPADEHLLGLLGAFHDTGFGNVGRAFFSLLREKADDIAKRYGLALETLAVARAEGCFHSGGPLEARHISRGGEPWTKGNTSWREGLRATGLIAELGPGGCLVECTVSNIETGEPGMSYISSAFHGGWNAVAASKGALVVGLPSHRTLAAENGVLLKFSAATAAALPTLDVGLVSFAGARIEGIQWILNGPSNYVLTRMGEGLDYLEALREAQGKGIAEPDPASDVGGWDTAAKILLNCGNKSVERSRRDFPRSPTTSLYCFHLHPWLFVSVENFLSGMKTSRYPMPCMSLANGATESLS